MFSVRGATTIENDCREDIRDSTIELIEKIISENGICKDDIISLIFTCTKDICAGYPAEHARALGLKHAGLICLQEMYVENSLEKCIRVLMLVDTEKCQSAVKHIYLKKASDLRPDLLQDF